MKSLTKGKILKGSFAKLLPFVSVLVMIVALSLYTRYFLTWVNLSSIVRQHAQIIIMAVGMTFVIISGGIDLSVGSMMALSGVCGAMLMTLGVPVVLAVLGGCFAGVLCGLLNGLLISRLRISPFIATLGTMQVFRGLVLQITKGLPVYKGIPASFGILRNGNLSDLIPPGFLDSVPILPVAVGVVVVLALLVLRYSELGKRMYADRIPLALILTLLVSGLCILAERLRNVISVPMILALLIVSLIVLLLRQTRLGKHVYADRIRPPLLLSVLVGAATVLTLRLRESTPIPLVLILVIAVGASLILRYTRLGRYSYAIGSNVEAAHHSGIKVGTYIVLIYAVSGFLTGFAGMIHSSSLGGGRATEGVGYELRVIAAVVIGGGSLMGGEGSVLGTIIGALFMALLLNACVHLHISDYIQQIVIGGLIVLAVAFDQFRKRKLEGGGV
jgi:ribose/xylose/arabinose/galactoside ABC-type transport system permease subunit